MRVLAVGQFDYSRHVLTALAGRGAEVEYGITGTPTFRPDERAGIRTFTLPRKDRRGHLARALTRVDPDVVLVGTASYDGSNRAALDLYAARPRVPVVRFYKEFVLRPSVVERDVLCGADGVVAGGEREALYFRAVYGLDPDRVHVLDPDLVSATLLPDECPPRLSARDGEPHVVLGGNLKSDDSEFDYRDTIRGLAERGVHVHVHAMGFSRWIAPGRALDPESDVVRADYAPLWELDRVHLEQPVFGREQLRVWARYDAGITQRASAIFRPELTVVQSMNLPSKYSYYLGAGLPIAVADDALPSLRALLADDGVLVVHRDLDDLAARLHDLPGLAEMGSYAREVAPRHTAEARTDGLLGFIDDLDRRRSGADGGRG